MLLLSQKFGLFWNPHRFIRPFAYFFDPFATDTFLKKDFFCNSNNQPFSTMKKVLLTFLAFAAMITAKADGYPYLLFQMTNGTVYSMSVESLSMNIDNGQLVVTNSEETQTFTLAELGKMFFSESTTNIGEIFSTDSGEVAVYTVTGAFLGNYSNAKEALKTLKSGMYLLRTKSNTIKIAVQ